MPIKLAPSLIRTAAIAAVLLACAPIARAETVFRFNGHGFGHGIGLGQYGAQGMALKGSTYEEILSHFYTGTTIGPAPTSVVRALLLEGRSVVSARSADVITARDDATGATVSVAAGTTVSVRRLAGSYAVEVGGAERASGWAGPVVLEPGASAIVLLGRAQNLVTDGTYRGRIRIFAAASGSLSAVNVVGLEDYLKGVVPREVPSAWETAALRAQAVAARSYAIATRKAPGAAFDVYVDERSQVYGGIKAEQPSTSAAVSATAGQVVMYEGKTIVAYFSSSTGGRSAAIEEVFPNGKPTPYLVAVPDPGDSISPHHDWRVDVGATRVATALGYPGEVRGVSVDAFPSGRVREVRVSGSGGTVTYPSATVRRALGLRSTWFNVGGAPAGGGGETGDPQLRLDRPQVRGRTVLLRGRAIPGAVSLEGDSGTGWRAIATSLVSDDGSVAFQRTLGEALRYRLSVGARVSTPVSVAVRTGLVLRPAARAFRGRIYPARAGVTIALQHVVSGTWRWYARGTTRADGSYRFAVRPTAGRWRTTFRGSAVLQPSRSPEVRYSRAGRRLQAAPARALQWDPADPLYPRQWNLRRIRAFNFWDTFPQTLWSRRVKVAVVDGGIDRTIPELTDFTNQSVVVATKDFTRGGAKTSRLHGTAVAGILAGQPNSVGFAGVDPFVDLLDARVVEPDGSIEPAAEARAIRWAVDQGAKVINLSLGGVRKPGDRSMDQYSPVEAAAIQYAVRHDVVVVAAVGNSPSPYRWASWPAALPHVVGVSAIGPDGRTPPFSNRDGRYNDLAAPGVGILTAVPASVASSGLSVDAPPGDVIGVGGTVEGTSFAAPHVSAAAALLRAVHPELRADQVMTLLEATAIDIAPPFGSPATREGRDALTGAGLLDIFGALTLARDPLDWPRRDTGEPNDAVAPGQSPALRVGSKVVATIDRGDDPVDTYPIYLRKGQSVTVSIEPLASDTGELDLVAWQPILRNRTIQRAPAGSTSVEGSFDSLPVTAASTGTHLVQVFAMKGGGAYRLTVSSDLVRRSLVSAPRSSAALRRLYDGLPPGLQPPASWFSRSSSSGTSRR